MHNHMRAFRVAGRDQDLIKGKRVFNESQRYISEIPGHGVGADCCYLVSGYLRNLESQFGIVDLFLDIKK